MLTQTLRLTAALGMSALVAAPAYAACPTGADMDVGVGALRDDNVFVVYFTLDELAVAQTIDYGGGLKAHNVLFRGAYPFTMRMKQDEVEDEASTVTFSYEFHPETIAVPAPGLTQELHTLVRPKLDAEYPELQVATWGEATQVAIGACQFEGFYGFVDYVNDQTAYRETLVYLPDLGISLQLGFEVAGDPSQTYSYAFTDIVAFE